MKTTLALPLAPEGAGAALWVRYLSGFRFLPILYLYK